jgi:hypothetical protein
LTPLLPCDEADCVGDFIDDFDVALMICSGDNVTPNGDFIGDFIGDFGEQIRSDVNVNASEVGDAWCKC